MTFFHLLALIYIFVWYRASNAMINKRWQNAGSADMGWFKSSKYLYREGETAVKVGKIKKYLSILLIIIFVTDIIGLHNLTLYALIADILIYNFVLFFLYPVKSEISSDKGD